MSLVCLVGVPRSGKSSAALALQRKDARSWLILGVDHAMAALPESLKPGIGLRPGGERPDFEPIVEQLYRAHFRSVRGYVQLGFHVLVDLSLHNRYASELRPTRILYQELAEVQPYLVRLRCDATALMQRRVESGYNADWDITQPIPEPVVGWQLALDEIGPFDLELDTTVCRPDECALEILRLVDRSKPRAIEQWRTQ
jgi:chloramphenicol 3-O phosphotransferase